MREQTIINEFKALWGALQNGINGLKIHMTGEALRSLALQNALIAKGVITQEELTKALSEEIQKMNSAAEEAAKAKAEPKAPELILPTTAQVAAVEETKGAAPETVIEAPQTPPQA
jgi:hypothetical protein